MPPAHPRSSPPCCGSFREGAMSRLRQTKIAQPSNPPTNTEELFYMTSGPGYASPPALMSVDESGNLAALAHFAVLDYRLIKVTAITVTGTSTYTPSNGTRAIFVECVGGGGQGGGAATSSTQVSVGSGGGAGAYSAKWITGVNATYSVTVGVGGTTGGAGATGQNGADTTFGSGPLVTAKGGTGGVAMAAGTTLITQDGTAGGAEASGVGDILVGGGDGSGAVRIGSGANA